MEPIKFSLEYSHLGTVYYEPVNPVAFELLEFLRPNGQSCVLNETMAERVFDWLEALGHEVKIVQSRDYNKALGV